MKRFTTCFCSGLLLVLHSLYLFAQPIAGFAVTYPIPACQPASISFTNTSTSDTSLAYAWDFGLAGSSDTATNPIFTYSLCGTFLVTLIATDANGQSDTATSQVVIHCRPDAEFVAGLIAACDSSTIHFTDQSSSVDSITSWQWNFGDPSSGILNTSSEASPSHLFDSAGIFSVSLIITSSAGCMDTATDTITIYETVSLFEQSFLCLHDVTQFTDLSTSTDTIISWLWNFDDPSEGNNHSTLQNASHIFSHSGDYDVRLTITTEQGCTDVLDKIITIFPLPAVSAVDDQLLCSGDSVLMQAAGASSYEWLPSSFLTDPLISDPIAFPIATTEYFVTGTDSNGCQSTDSVTVTVLPPPNADAGNDTAICLGTAATLHATGGMGYHWTPSVNISDDSIANPVVSPLSTTTYFVAVTDEAGCTATDSVTVTVTSLPVVSITGLNDHYCLNGASVTLTASPAGGFFSGDGVSGNEFNPSSLSSDSTYSVIYFYEDSTGCTGSDTESFEILSPPDIFISANDSSLCLNASPVGFTLIPDGGILSGNGIANNLFDPSLTGGAGIYTIFYSVTDTSGCSNTDSLKMTVHSLPNINAGNDTVICAGDSLQLHASGGLNYLWLPDSSLTNGQLQDPVAFPVITTNYVVVTTDSNECANSDSILLTVFYPLAIDAGADVSLCKGDTSLLQATGGSDYVWSPSSSLNDPFISNPLASPEQTTTYTVTVNATSACPAVDSVLVTVHALPIITASGDSIFCKDDSVPLMASGGMNYLWLPSSFLSDNSIADPIAFPDSSATYIVTGTDTNNCSSNDTVFLQVLPLPDVDAGIDTSLCLGDSIQLNASGADTYSWTPPDSLSDNGIPNPIAFPVSSITYVVTGADAYGCVNTDSINVIVVSQSQVDAGSDTSVCRGDSIMLQASGGINYSWLPSIGLSDPFTSNPFASPPLSITYTVTVTVGTTCEFSDTVQVIVHDLPVVNAGTDSSLCPNDSLQLHASGAIIYEWLPVNSLNDPLTADPNAFPFTNTMYIVTGTDVFGCMNSDSVLISVLPSPDANAGSDTSICIGESVTLHAVGGNTFTWSPDSSLNNFQIADPVAHPVVTTSYILMVNDGGTCSGYDSVIITVNPLPSADAGSNQSACAGLAVQMNASGGIDYIWSPVNGLSNSSVSNPFATINTSITYFVTVTDLNGCSAIDSVHIEIAPPLLTSVSDDTLICKGTAALLKATGGQVYSWSPAESINDPHASSVTATPNTPTTYSVIISDGICYSDTLAVRVFVSSPFVNAGDDAMVNGGNFQLSAVGSQGSYEWFPAYGLSCVNCSNPVAALLQTTTYTVTVTDSAGCEASDELTLTAGCNEDELFIPNAFTPDDNGHNDIFLIRTTGSFQLNYLRILDRWGKVIFESKDIHDGWDGTYKNKLLSPGVFLYILEGDCGSGDLIHKEGNVTLLK